MLQRAIALGILTAAILLQPAFAFAADESMAAAAPSISVGGAVDHPTDFTVADLRKLPATNETVFFHTGHGATTALFTGVSLWSLLQQVGIKTDPAVRNEMLHKYLVVAGSDGYYAVLALGEIHPEFGGEQVMVAYDQDGKPLGDGAVRLIVPGDKGGGRDVMKLRSISVRDAQP